MAGLIQPRPFLKAELGNFMMGQDHLWIVVCRVKWSKSEFLEPSPLDGFHPIPTTFIHVFKLSLQGLSEIITIFCVNLNRMFPFVTIINIE